MSFTQQTFFGSSIRGFDANLGWNDSVSQLTVRLVDDPDNGDLFQQPGMGISAGFSYNGWEFKGIVQNWRQTGGSDGSPLYEISITDPRELLDGVELILDGYNGTTGGVPNLINVYGYLESVAFGGSGRNDSGIPWINVRSVAQTLTAASTPYGGPIQFRGENYLVDLTGLPLVPATYRVGGTSISLLSFIQEMCGAASADFFVTLEVVNGNKVITVHSISRRIQPTFGKINQFVSSVTGAVSKDVGFELRNEITSKFVSGGPKKEIFFQTSDIGNPNRGDDDTIAPYWGVDLDGNLAIGYDFNDSHTVKLDARAVDVTGIGDKYTTDVGELRAAIESQSAWESFLWYNHDNEKRLDDEGEETDEFNVHVGKASKIGIISNTIQNIAGIINGKDTVDKLDALAPQDLLNLDGQYADKSEANIHKLYQFVSDYANEFYGRQFMVRVPFVSTKIDEDDQLVTSREPTDGGFIAEASFPNAISSKLMPELYDALTLSDGRLPAYARFNNAQNYDFSQISPSDIIVNQDGRTVFVKGSLSEKMEFLNNRTKFSPRVVFQMSGPVYRKAIDFNGVVGDMLLRQYKKLGDSDAPSKVIAFFTKYGADALKGAKSGEAIQPDLIACPLKSNVDSYGPWLAIGAQGKVDFENDESLVPWNYGGFAAMNAVGNAKVSEALSNQQVAENGSVEFPGAPGVSLGAALIQGGPYVTDINVSVSEGGVTTSYRMNTWTPEFGQFSKQRQSQIQSMAQKSQNDRRNFRNNRQTAKNLNSLSGQKRQFFNIVNRQKPNSSHQIIGGQNFITVDTEASGDTREVSHGVTNVVTLPSYNSVHQNDSDNANKGAVSLDGLFRPFSAEFSTPDATGVTPVTSPLSTYTQPSGGATFPTAITLDPFSGSGDFSYVGGVNRDKPIALRGPLVVTGYGIDVDGYPVPGQGGTFVSNYKTRSHLWKTGPVDLRWDQTRGVWVTGTSTSSGIRGGIITEVNEGDLEGKFNLLSDADPMNTDSVEEEGVDFRNFLNIPVCVDQKVFVTKIATKWHLVNAEYTGFDVVTDITCDNNSFTPTKRTIYLGSAFGQEKVCDGSE